MDVTCERCSTAYEFDDALVSERGTTVKCTNCGHQFKVRRPQPAGAPERWLVRTIDGRELEFRALRELQAAIGQALITRDDVLSRGGSRPRRLGSIAELEPFFAAAAGSAAQHPTNLGLGPKAPPRGRGAAVQMPTQPVSRTEHSVAIPLHELSSEEDTRVMGAARRSNPSVPVTPLPGVVITAAGAPAPPVHGADAPRAAVRAASHIAEGARADTDGASELPTLTGLGQQAARARDAGPRATARSSPGAARDLGPPTAATDTGPAHDMEQAPAVRDDWTQPPPPAEPAPVDRARARPESRDAPVDITRARPEGRDAAERTSAPGEPVPSEPPPNIATPTPPVRVSYMPDDAYAEPRFSSVASARRTGAARWIVGLFVAGMVVLAFATVGRRFLVTTTPAQNPSDARVAVLLAEGEKSLGDGDLELAKEQFDKASALAERDPRVAADLARLAVTKADVEWLRARLLPPDDPEQATARRGLEQALQRARRAADRAAEVAPTDTSVTRSRIDALRLAGDLEGARKLVGAVAGASAAPENALVLAALDLAESRPDWSTVIGRLRTAVSGEGNLGRARSLLVYALARSSDVAGARAELERLRALPRPHPLLGALAAYLNRAEKTVDVSALPDASAKPRASASASASAAPAVAPSPQPRELAPVRERPAPPEPHAPEPHVPTPPTPEPGGPAGPIDTSDLPGVKVPVTPPPAPSPPQAPPSPPPSPPGVDTSDLPGFK